MEYNILHGFHSVESPFEHEKERQDQVIKIVKEKNPDILILTEACYGKKFMDVFVDYKKLFNFPYYYHANKDHEHGVSVLSKYPLSDSQNFSFGKVHFVRSKINLEKKIINLDVVHPHPSLSEEEKERFIGGVLRDFKTPYILVGDLNVCSFKDNYSKKEMIEGFSKISKYAEKIVSNLLSFETTKKIESFKLIDTYKKIHKKEDNVNFTVPTDLLSKDKSTGMRCDFIFCSKNFQVIESEIIKNKLTESASDHYPIYSILKI